MCRDEVEGEQREWLVTTCWGQVSAQSGGMVQISYRLYNINLSYLPYVVSYRNNERVMAFAELVTVELLSN
jgi:hypothetical protein